MAEETLNLGGNIALTGFNGIEPAQMVVVKKIVGSYAKKFSEKTSDFESLSLRLKGVHERETSKKFEINGKLLVGGKPITSEDNNRNLFILLDSVLKKIEEQVLGK